MLVPSASSSSRGIDHMTACLNHARQSTWSATGVAAFASRLKAIGQSLVKDVHETRWGTREFVIQDDQGHTLYLGEPS
jgi:hypothetical protein